MLHAFSFFNGVETSFFFVCLLFGLRALRAVDSERLQLKNTIGNYRKLGWRKKKQNKIKNQTEAEAETKQSEVETKQKIETVTETEMEKQKHQRERKQKTSSKIKANKLSANAKANRRGNIILLFTNIYTNARLL